MGLTRLTPRCLCQSSVHGRLQEIFGEPECFKGHVGTRKGQSQEIFPRRLLLFSVCDVALFRKNRRKSVFDTFCNIPLPIIVDSSQMPHDRRLNVCSELTTSVFLT